MKLVILQTLFVTVKGGKLSRVQINKDDKHYTLWVEEVVLGVIILHHDIISASHVEHQFALKIGSPRLFTSTP